MNIIGIIEPAVRRLSPIKVPFFCHDTHREHLTAVIFSSLTYHGIELDPQIEVEMDESIDLRGSIMMTAHFYLNFFALRWLYDRGYSNHTVILTGTSDWKILGTRTSLQMFHPGSKSIGNIKKMADEGEILTICIEHTKKIEGWQKKLDISNREIYVNDRVVRFAERRRIPIYFFVTRLDEAGRIRLKITPAGSTQTDEVIRKYGEFLDPLLPPLTEMPASFINPDGVAAKDTINPSLKIV